jgi:methylthioribose-1-phosphate isomerase
VNPIEWLGDKVRILDQTRLPDDEGYIETADYREVATAIKQLKVRGAPAIGVAAGYGVAVGALGISTCSLAEYRRKLDTVIETIAATRPTARNLFMATERMKRIADAGETVESIRNAIVAEAVRIHEEEVESTRRLCEYGAELIKDGMAVLTHCNTGPLATTGYGTALGVLIHAHEHGKRIQVYNTETRPLLQGSRLTACELQWAKIPFTLITDSMAGHFMKEGKVDCVIVGADRIAANGDTANKIGTYSLAVLAKAHGIPFYVAAPPSTFDTSIESGEQIVIEERHEDEVTYFKGVRSAPVGVRVANPAFDVTPAKYIKAIMTENGVINTPFVTGIRRVVTRRPLPSV